MHRDMTIRIAAARHSDREENVMLAVLKACRIPEQPPSDGQDLRQPFL
jgi:hypothetical protein